MSYTKAHDVHDRERTEDIQIDENIDFDSMYLSELVLSGLKTSGFLRPSPIQLSAIPLGRCGLDMIVQAKSGTGKTCVFTVVALEMVSVSAFTTQVLILTPTREIAVQVTQVINAIGSKMPGLRASTFIGGIHLSLDRAKLQLCHIAVGTPGRITQLIELGLLRLNNIRLLVLDEADQLLTGQFADAIASITSALPLNKQVIAASATYTEDIARVAEGLMRSPNHVRLGKDAPALLGVDQYVKLLPFHGQPHRRQQAKFVELMSIITKVTFNQCLVFSNSQLRAESVCNKLRAAGWPVSFLTGGQAQKDRLIALDALCSYKCRVLVSTDLSARGLDSEHVNLVINLDLPRDHATYLHRVGRAGRFGSRGSAMSLATEGDEWQAMRAIASKANVRIRLLTKELTSDIVEKDENPEYVECLDDDELALYMNISGTYEYCDSVKENDREIADPKGKKEGKSMKLADSKQKIRKTKFMSEYTNGQLSDSSLSSEFSNMHIDNRVCRKGSSHRSKEKKRLEMEKLIKENAEQKAKTLAEVQDVLKKVNVEQSSYAVSFDSILSEVSEQYSNIAADDNPSISIPSLPGTVSISEAEGRALKTHWKTVEEDLQQVIYDTSNSGKDLNVSYESALQGKIEGKDCSLFLNTIDKRNHVDVMQEVVQTKSVIGDKSVNGEIMSSFINSKAKLFLEEHTVADVRLKETYSQKRYSKCNGNAESKGDVRAKNLRKRKNRKNQDNYRDYDNVDSQRNYPEYDCVNSQSKSHEYGNDAGVDDYGYFADQQNSSDWHTYAAQFDTVQSESVSEDTARNYDNFVRYNIGMHQKYLDSLDKFTAMMDYVQTMGRVSSWIARDYHSGL